MMKRVVFLLESTRGLKTCTESISDYLEARFPGCEVQRWRAHQIFQDRDQVAAFEESLRGAQLLVLCPPVYVHSLPWPFQEVLTALADSPPRGSLSGLKVMTLIHSGYLEDIQRQTCFEWLMISLMKLKIEGDAKKAGVDYRARPYSIDEPVSNTNYA